MNTKTTKTPHTKRELSGLTVREAADMAVKEDLTFGQWLEKYGPTITMPPAGYTLAPKSENRWIGTEKMNRGWIITPVWDGATNRRTIELWTSKDPDESDARLTPMEAIQLAADLIELAKDALPEDFAAGDMG